MTQTSAGDGSMAVRLEAVTKIYGKRDGAVTALDRLTIGFPPGRFAAVMGPSGSGKSTCLHCAAGLDRPTGGRVYLGEVELTGLPERQLTELRRRRMGFVFQSYNLIPSLDTLQNILLPMRLARRSPEPGWVDAVVERLGLEKRLRHRPHELSGGQQQRVAMARALVVRPDVVFADEPTGALDTRAGAAIMTLLRDAVDTLGQTVVMVTHDPAAAARADMVAFLRDGRLIDVMANPTLAQVVASITRLEEVPA